MPSSEEKIDLLKKKVSYSSKVWQTVAIVSLLVAVILIVRVAFDVLLMALAGSLIAVYFHGLGDLIEKRIKVKRKLAMLISVLGTLIMMVLLFWFIG